MEFSVAFLDFFNFLGQPIVDFTKQVFESGNFIFLVTELCGKGELFDLIVDMSYGSNFFFSKIFESFFEPLSRRLNENDARRIFSEILSAVEHAHSNSIVHR